MAILQTSGIMCSSSSSSSSSYSQDRRGGIIRATLIVPRRMTNISLPGLQTKGIVEELELHNGTDKKLSPINVNTFRRNNSNGSDPLVMSKLYAILEAVADRMEMHKNIGEQRSNWNSVLLTSINALTLAAATMTGIAATSVISGSAPVAALKVSSTVMYLSATGMLSIMNKIQPSQLAEEQRNATRLFKQLHNQIQTIIATGNPTTSDVKEMMEKVLALDKAYPLPLLGAMLEKFPTNIEPAVWWPEQRRRQAKGLDRKKSWNGWNGKLEEEMTEIFGVIRKKDKADYLRLGGKALKLNKFLAISGPVLTGLAALGSSFVGSPDHGSWAVVLGVVAGALASAVNTFEHGGQVGMVFEMYRSNAGFFKLMEESIESNLTENDMEGRENGELFEMKVALQLGRSLSQLRDLAVSTSGKGDEDIEEFASKLF
ncbi:putative F-box protein [Abeliophyllum distichum]|uniref:F-box protein n=1 Tax=Abeliophyllum distichum TaxID=126358 RepID=A0ABD1QHG7_9LAMI